MTTCSDDTLEEEEEVTRRCELVCGRRWQDYKNPTLWMWGKRTHLNPSEIAWSAGGFKGEVRPFPQTRVFRFFLRVP